VLRWQSGFASVAVVLVMVGLVIGDLADGGLRRWGAGHALTTDTVGGILVLLVTVLVADQVVRRRQIRDRSRAIAAQAAIMMGQAARTSRAVSAALDGSGDREAATDEVRTYMMMLLVGAPVLIDVSISRGFLEAAQHLGGEMTHALTAMRPDKAKPSSSRLDDAVARLRAASTPLQQLLTPEELTAVGEYGYGGGQLQRDSSD
jgi:hypothetical protein